MITRYGYTIVWIAVAVSALLLAGAVLCTSLPLTVVMIILALAISGFVIHFFRDPERTPPTRKDIILAPADGKIIIQRKLPEHKYLQAPGTQISIFMSPLNVHVNRIPIDGTVDYLKYNTGKFTAAFKDKASEENERMEIGIKAGDDKVFFTQVAGSIARRIVCELKEGEEVTKGSRFGMIRFGSRSDIVAGETWQPMVEVGDIVTAGETILFEKRSTEGTL